jgi:hypothetical protein
MIGKAALSAMTGIPERTLDDWAYKGVGPPFVKAGSLRRYLMDDVYEWIAANRHGGDAA